MNARAAVGTIDNPQAHDPQKQTAPLLTAPFLAAPFLNLSATDTLIRRNDAEASYQNRNHQMHLMQEALARAQYQDRLSEAESERRARRLVRARRLQRRAERASLRARRAIALAVMQ
jgi:hypothetical protein